jgi:TRAP-type mannitol/chloroaromatic compound transport system permease small subunit
MVVGFGLRIGLLYSLFSKKQTKWISLKLMRFFIMMNIYINSSNKIPLINTYFLSKKTMNKALGIS